MTETVAPVQLRPRADALLRVENLAVEFGRGHGKTPVQAVSDVSFDVLAGETLGLVGESSCGKSTAARAVMQLTPPTDGKIYLGGQELRGLNRAALRAVRPKMQMIFQDPISSLNPRRTVAQIVAEPAIVWRRASGERLRALVDETLLAVGLDPATTRDRRPTQFSGGQCQRICIARALILQPEILICDEPVSALDVSIQAQILNLLEELRETRGLALIFISHDLAVVKNISDRIAVMYLGKLCEMAESDTLYRRPAHPYTRVLVDAIPTPDPRAQRRRMALVGELPSAADPPSGCRFRTRCPRATELCAQSEPPLRQISSDHYVACHFPIVETAPEVSGPDGAQMLQFKNV
jgi:peptide/nickel transport system ATP-binding protein